MFQGLLTVAIYQGTLKFPELPGPLIEEWEPYGDMEYAVVDGPANQDKAKQICGRNMAILASSMTMAENKFLKGARRISCPRTGR